MRRVMWVMIGAFLVGTFVVLTPPLVAQNTLPSLPPDFLEGDYMELGHP